MIYLLIWFYLYISFRKDISFPFPMVSTDIVKGNVATEDHNTQRNTDESDILVGMEETIFALKNLKKIIAISLYCT